MQEQHEIEAILHQRIMKPSLLLLHGALGSSEQLRPLAAILGEEFDFHLIDFSGHGGKSLPHDFGIERFRDDVISYIDSHQIRQTHIFGFSMGGYVGLKVAESSPNRVGKIITLGTKFNWTPETSRHEVKFLDPEKIMEKVPDFGRMLAERHHPEDWKAVMRRTAEMMIALGENPLWVPGFNTVDHEVLISVGENDHMVSAEESLNTARNLIHGEFRIIPKLLHPIEKADPEVISTMILDFLL